MNQPPHDTADVVIIGSGLAGYALAREIRKHRTDLSLLMITADGGEVYSKPNLSNALSQGKSAEQMIQRNAIAMQDDLHMPILTHRRVIQIDRSHRKLTISTPDQQHHAIAYQNLVLALGADPRPLTVPGHQLAPITTVNDLDDYRYWRNSIRQPAHFLLVGGGLIGCEFANDLCLAGHRVTLVEPASWPLGRLVPAPIGHEIATALRGIGVDLHLKTNIDSFLPTSALLSSGIRLNFDHALSAIGLQPRTQLAEQAGLAVGRGIKVDAFLRTRDPHIFALGDCAETPAGLLPYVLPLMSEAKALAQTLCGEETRLHLRALPVTVKLPCLPTVICPPAMGTTGEWHISGEGPDRRGIFQSADGQESGFVLTGQWVSERQSLAARMPPLLP